MRVGEERVPVQKGEAGEWGGRVRAARERDLRALRSARAFVTPIMEAIGTFFITPLGELGIAEIAILGAFGVC